MKPRRIQLSRKRGWRKPEGAVVCSRPGRWGNWYRIEGSQRRWSVIDAEAPADEGGLCGTYESQRQAALAAVELFEADFQGGFVDEHAADVCRELRGKSLACWCKLCPAHAAGKPWDVECADCAPCHCDYLLRCANAS